jgi:hypothetical protein
MIGRVGRTPRKQIEGILHTLGRKLEEAEARNPRNEVEIANIRMNIVNYELKLAAVDR